MSLYWTGKWHITFPAFLILSDTSSLSLNDPLLSTTEYVSGAVVTWQGCLDRLGEVTENVTDTSRTHGSSLFFNSDRKGQPVSESLATRTSSLLGTPVAGLKRKQGFKEGRISSRKALLCAFSFSVPVLLPWNLCEKRLPSLDYRAGAEVGTVSDPDESGGEDREGGQMPRWMGRAGWRDLVKRWSRRWRRGLLGLEERVLRGECCGSALVCNCNGPWCDLCDWERCWRVGSV